MGGKPLRRALFGGLVLLVGAAIPGALASADGSAASSSSGNWISTVSPGGTTPSHLTQVDTTDHADAQTVTALNAGGRGVMAWQDTVTGYVMVSHIEPGDGWSTPQALAPGSQPAVAIDSSGDVTVTWVDTNGDVEYAYRPASSASFVIAPISDSGAPGTAASPEVVMDSGGNAWMVWSIENTPVDSAGSVEGAYLPAGVLAVGGSPSWQAQLASGVGLSYPASLATNPSGSAIIAAFPESDNNSIGIAYAEAGAGSLPTPAYEVPNPASGSMDTPVVALSDSDDAALTWDECDNPYGSSCEPSSSGTVEVASATASQLADPTGVAFTAPQTVPLGTVNGQYSPQVAVNDDEVALGWGDLTQTSPYGFSIDGATEPLADLNGGSPAWRQLDPNALGNGTTDAATGIGPQVAIDENSNVTLAWGFVTTGSNLYTVNAATAKACAATCSAVGSTQLDSEAGDGGGLSLAAAPDGDALLGWASYSPSHGVIPTAVAAAYDPGPALSHVQIPTTATAGVAVAFSVQSTDSWTGLEGPATTTWNFGDGTTATGVGPTHTYSNPGTYTVTVTSLTPAASSTTSSTIVVGAAPPPPPPPASTPQVTVSGPDVATPPLSGVAAWGSSTPAGSVSADMTVPALSCAGNTAAATGQALGVRLWGSQLSAGSATAFADFAGVNVECRHARPVYEPSLTISDVSAGTSTSQRAALTVTPGDLLLLSIRDSSTGATLSITDLSTPDQAPAVVAAPSLAPDAGWQVGAFPIPGVSGPYPTVPTDFTNVSAGGTGIGALSSLQSSTWGEAGVSPVGRTDNQLSVVFASIPKPPAGGSVAAPAQGKIRFRRPGSHHWLRLTRNTPLPAGTLIDATDGYVQLSNPEPHGQSQSVTAWGGEFRTRSDSKGATTIRVTGFWTGADSGASGARAGQASGRKKQQPKPVTGNLWAKGHGKFTTKGNDGAAAVLGTKWLTRNLKKGTLFKVAKNRYDHNDRIRVTVYHPHRHTVILRQGQSILAPAPTPKPKAKVKVKPTPKPKPKPIATPVVFTIVGVNRVDGRYNVNAPGYYELVLTSKVRPYYVDAAVAPQQPGGGDSPFYRDGSLKGVPRWEVHFQIKQSLATYQLWNVGIKIGDKLYVAPLRLN